MEKSGIYHFTVEPFSEDCCGNLSWGNLGNLILRCASLHAGTHGFGYQQMIANHHVWVLSRLVLEMDSLPRTGESFSIETWIDRVYRQFTDRHFNILRPDGTIYGHATSIWSLIDTATRQPADLTQLPDGGFARAINADRPSPIAPMGRIRLKAPDLIDSHKAVYTDLDINGHVNSIRYLELLLNQIAPTDLKTHGKRRIEMAYCLEAYCGDRLNIYRAFDSQNPLGRLYEIRKDSGDIVVKGSLQV